MKYVSSFLLLLAVLETSSREVNAQESWFELNSDWVVTHHLESGRGLSSNFLTGVAVDSAGVVWATSHSGLVRFDGRWARSFDAEVAAVLGTARVVGPIYAPSGHLLVQDPFNRRDLELLEHGNTLRIVPPSDPIGQGRRMQRIRDWMQTTGGRVDADSIVVGELAYPTRPEWWHLDPDEAGGLWIGTQSSGLIRVARARARWIASPGSVNFLATDSQGRIWVNAHKKLYVDGVQVEAPIERIGDGHLSGDVLHVVTGRELYSLDTNTLEWDLHSASNRLWRVRRSPDGAIWTIRSAETPRHPAGAWVEVTTDSSSTRLAQLERPGRYRFEVAGESAVWVIGSGLLRCTPDACVEQVPLDSWNLEARGFLADKSGRCWIGSYGNGLLVGPCAGPLEAWSQLTPEQGLPDAFVNSVHAGEGGRVWIGSHSGIYALRVSEVDAWIRNETPRIHPFVVGTDQGLAELESNGGAPSTSFLDQEGNLWHAMATGIAVVDTGMEEAPPAPQLYFDSAEAGGRVLWHAGEPLPLRIPTWARETSFRVVVPTTQSRDNVLVEWSLNGRDAWTTSNEISLPVAFSSPGHTTLHMRAVQTLDGARGPISLMTVDVVPFWWETWFFRTMLGLSLFGAGVVAYWTRSRRQRLLNQRLEREVKERTKQLSSAVTRSQRDNEIIVEQASHLIAADSLRRRFLSRLADRLKLHIGIGVGSLEHDTETRAVEIAREEFSDLQRLATELQGLVHSTEIEALHERSTVLIPPLLVSILDKHSRRMTERKVVARYNDTDHPDLTALTNRSVLIHVLEQVMDIAIRRCRTNGQIMVESGARNGSAFITVFDDGPPFENLEPEDLFDPHLLGRLELPGSSSSVGLGLAASRQMIERLGGSLGVDFAPIGSCVTVLLPEHGDNTGTVVGGTATEESGSRHPVAFVLAGEPGVDKLASLLSSTFDVSPVSKPSELARLHPVSAVVCPARHVGAVMIHRVGQDVSAGAIIVALVSREDSTEAKSVLELGADAVMGRYSDPEVLGIRLSGLLRARDRSRKHQESAAGDSNQHLVMGLVHKHLRDSEFGPSQLAELVGLSYSQLARRTVAEMGLTPAALIRQERARLAAQIMIEHPNRNLSEIAFEVGFNSVSSFNRAFSSCFRSSPRVFRTRNLS
ncbi:MAG: helix-turn-helix domain-containing protein [Rhodothermales bacterium]|nr:helix-turn-helix domain-containing protein [Rhodothermales bacterium]MBO6780200.1 helix-turn-helix domain-containing protein [Rhodothermales bacterium]